MNFRSTFASLAGCALIVCIAAIPAVNAGSPTSIQQDPNAQVTAEITPDPNAALATLPAPSDGSQVQATVTATPGTTLTLEQTEALPVLAAARADLDILASDRLGADTRPPGWNGDSDPNNPALNEAIRLDLEALATAILGENIRPDGWIGYIVSVPLLIARDIRHDLELLADTAIGDPLVRPNGWQGDDPIYRCSRSAQNLLEVLERVYQYFPQVDFSRADACEVLEEQVNFYVETRVVQPFANATPIVAFSLPTTDQPFQVDSAFVIAFADLNARRRYGVIPAGTGFSILARSGNQFSNMMLIAGADFQVFTDFIYTPVTEAQYTALPEVGDGQTVFCNASWCE